MTPSPPSTMPLSGEENQFLNSLCDWNTCGIKKCIKDHSSMRSFCSGVPVISSRRLLLKLSSVCQRCDRQFLIMCASSSMRYFHFLRLKTVWSWVISLYVVMHTWNELGLDQPWRFSLRSFAVPK